MRRSVTLNAKVSSAVHSASGRVRYASPAVSELTDLVDGTRSGNDLVEALVAKEAASPEEAQSLVHEAISFGLLAPGPEEAPSGAR